MCGIAGAFGPKQLGHEARVAALRLLARRGPDAVGEHDLVVGENQCTLLHTRLSIIDLDQRANQPMISGSLAVVFNGEVYNYVELRAELEGLGHAFKSTSDTEVLLNAYREWGINCLDRMEGMWAFALIDAQSGKLILARDRFGEKPLYYSITNGTLYFASEVNALIALIGDRPPPNLHLVKHYLVNGYRSVLKSPGSFFEGIHAVSAACYAEVSQPCQLLEKRYWTLRYRPVEMTEADALEGVRSRLIRATELRLRSDVPLAFCLSGGVDSSVLAGIAARQFEQDINTFSIVDSDERYDETANILATLDFLGGRHRSIRTTTKGFLERMADLVSYHAAPVMTISYYIQDWLAEAISRDGFRVAITGTAADELFTGYYDHYNFWIAEMIGDGLDTQTLLNEWLGGCGAHVNNPVLQDPLVFAKNPQERGHISLDREVMNRLMREPLDEHIAEREYSANLLRNRMMTELFEEVVPPILLDLDLNCMRWSIENRAPYLDRELAEFSYTIPNQLLVKGGYLKRLLREGLRDYLAPEVVSDSQKRGFNASIDSLLDRSDPKTRDWLLAPGPIFDIVERNAFEEFFCGDMTANSRSKFLFSFVSARLFLDQAVAPLDAAA